MITTAMDFTTRLTTRARIEVKPIAEKCDWDTWFISDQNTGRGLFWSWAGWCIDPSQDPEDTYVDAERLTGLGGSRDEEEFNTTANGQLERFGLKLGGFHEDGLYYELEEL